MSETQFPFDTQIILTDLSGKEIIRKNYAFEIGKNTVKLEGLSSLSEGVYVVLIKNEGRLLASEKMVR